MGCRGSRLAPVGSSRSPEGAMNLLSLHFSSPSRKQRWAPTRCLAQPCGQNNLFAPLRGGQGRLPGRRRGVGRGGSAGDSLGGASLNEMLLLSSCSLYQPEGGIKVQDCGRVSGKPRNEAVCSARFENRAVGGREVLGWRREEGSSSRASSFSGKTSPSLLPAVKVGRWFSPDRRGRPCPGAPSQVLSLQWAGRHGPARLGSTGSRFPSRSRSRWWMNSSPTSTRKTRLS